MNYKRITGSFGLLVACVVSNILYMNLALKVQYIRTYVRVRIVLWL